VSLYEFVKAVLRPITRAAFDVTVSGESNVPANGGLVVAANHRSYLDPPLLGTWFPRTIHFMAKEELFRIPVLGYLIGEVHAFPVTRDAADIGSIRRALRILKEGGAIGIFPEGTRNVSGDAKPKAGAVMLATTAHCPIVPVGLVHTAQATKRLRASHVQVRIGAPMTFQGSARKPTKAEIDVWTVQVADEIERLTSG